MVRMTYAPEVVCAPATGTLDDMTTDKPASPAQLRFLADLLRQVPASVHGVTDVDAAIDALAASPVFTTRKASEMIDSLKGMKAAQPAAPAAANGFPNRYAGKCGTCGAQVPAGAGTCRKVAGKWVAFHAPACPAAPPAPPVLPDPEEGLYQHDDGRVSKVYTTQNGRLAAKVLHGRTFSYQQGHLAIVKRALADGTAHRMSQAEAAAFGRLHGFCVNCGRDIDDDRSLAAGYGPVCAKRHGWWYPTYEEAADVLGRPVTRPSGRVVEPADGDPDEAAPVAGVPGTLDGPPVTIPTCQHCGERIAQVDADWLDQDGEAYCEAAPMTWKGEHLHAPAQ